jgi:hypothetical protein
VIVQLWEPLGEKAERAMQVHKALGIIELVEKGLLLDADAVVKIEFGNASFDTRQMLPQEIRIDGENLVVDLRPDAVQCKAIERGGSCGTNDSGEECCTTPTVSNPLRQFTNFAVTSAACTPDSGCC